jgi:formate/nitrite transporter FocA (FNT family)
VTASGVPDDPTESAATGDNETDSAPTPVSQEDALRAQLEIGTEELERPTSGLALSGLSAGLDIGFGPLFMLALVSVASGVWTEPTLDLVTGLIYSVGFVFVVISGTELFTEHTSLAVVPVLDGRASLGDLGRLWGVVYATNVLGGAVFAAGIAFFGPAYGIVDRAAFLHLATPLVSHGVVPTFVAATLAGWLMSLLSWLVTSVEGSGARIALVVIVTTVIGFGHLPHSIAGNVEVLSATLATAEITLGSYARFMLLATAGNVVGGTVFVALLKYGYVVSGTDG